jgi:hypothetical protein
MTIKCSFGHQLFHSVLLKPLEFGKYLCFPSQQKR